MAIETRLAQPAFEVAVVENKNETDSPLTEFAKCAIAMRNALYQDKPLTEVEFLFMENHFQVIEMAHLRWKRQHGNIRL
jgi:hypothetical protein